MADGSESTGKVQRVTSGGCTVAGGIWRVSGGWCVWRVSAGGLGHGQLPAGVGTGYHHHPYPPLCTTPTTPGTHPCHPCTHPVPTWLHADSSCRTGPAGGQLLHVPVAIKAVTFNSSWRLSMARAGLPETSSATRVRPGPAPTLA